MRHHTNLLLGARTALDEQTQRRVCHHDHELGLLAELGQHLQLVRGRLGENRVQGDDERLRQLLGEGQHVLPVEPAEDPVLVLQDHHVDIETAECPGSAHVVAANFLPDHESRPRRCGRDGSLTTATTSARSMPVTPISVVRRSAANVPIPQARGGYVETIAVRMR